MGKATVTTTTQHSLKQVRARGFVAAVTECWIPATPAGFKGPIKRRDLFGFADILAFHPGTKRFLLVQTTAASGFSARVRKVQESPLAAQWLEAGGQIEVHGWKKPSEACRRWTVRIGECEL
jgi:hypothetical protein